ncbi:diguanylate cyclase domain-containing protein [Acinetobacter sp. BSP-28]|uniref:diguanylate cyclase domain-containing protein n=1 Tax=Acinetobacter sp. BSP-28 TaxID=3344661 RepID=UPI00376FA2A3
MVLYCIGFVAPKFSGYLLLKNGEAVSITATIGIVTVGQDETLENVIERADQAMYMGKQQGRDRTVFA